jgi:FtsZ-binding cell division protein ZapB
MKKKKKSNAPRHKRLKRDGRLQAAVHWLPKYEGENIVKGYSKHFAVDKLCAINELQMLGYEIDPEYIKVLKATLEGEQKARERRREIQKEKKMLEENADLWSDETFSFIAGYTSGGVPYGIRWDDENETEEDAFRDDEEFLESEYDDIPF